MNFWRLNRPDHPGTDLAEYIPEEYEECPLGHRTVSHPERRFDLSYHQQDVAILEKTAAVSDFIWVGSDLFVTDRVLRMFQEQGFTGFIPKPAKVTMRIRSRGGAAQKYLYPRPNSGNY